MTRIHEQQQHIENKMAKLHACLKNMKAMKEKVRKGANLHLNEQTSSHCFAKVNKFSPAPAELI